MQYRCVRILLVDPLAAIRDRIAARLADEGFDVRCTVASVAAAIDAALVHRPDAILTEAQLPDRRGPSVVVALRAHAPDATIYVVSNAIHFSAACIAAGANAFFDKSRDIDALFAALQAARSR